MVLRVGFNVRVAGVHAEGGLGDEDVGAEGRGGDFLAGEAVADNLCGIRC